MLHYEVSKILIRSQFIRYVILLVFKWYFEINSPFLTVPSIRNQRDWKDRRAQQERAWTWFVYLLQPLLVFGVC